MTLIHNIEVDWEDALEITRKELIEAYQCTDSDELSDALLKVIEYYSNQNDYELFLKENGLL